MPVHSRRGFLTQTLGAAWVGASLLEKSVLRAAQARAQAPQAPATLFEIEKVADGVYAALGRPAAFINCNAAIFENATDVLIVDTHSKPSAAAALAAQIRKQITAKPIRYIVNTHFHWDHIGGSPGYRKLAPHADILSSTTTRDLISEFGASQFKASVEEASKSLEEYSRRLAAAKTPAEKAHFELMVSGTRAFIAEMRNWTPELPDITFDETLVIHDKAHDLELAFRGRGHTAGDVVVFCPQKKAIACGDLLQGFLPFIGDGYPHEWPGTLRTLAADFPFEQAICGHGEVQRTRERLPQMAEYIEELTSRVAKGKREGHTVQQLQQEIAPATLKSLANGGYGEFVAGNMVRYDTTWALNTPAETLAGGLKENVASTFKALENH